MGPLLYSLVRFIKPIHVLEFGGGFTSIFLAQALADNATEISSGFGGIPWYFKPPISIDLPPRQLHVVDNIAHDHTTAHHVVSVSEALGLSDYITFHNCDAFDPELPYNLAPEPEVFNMIWIDIGAGDQIGTLVDSWWGRVSPQGGVMAVHSTLTNTTMRSWLSYMQEFAGVDKESKYGKFEIMSFLEPHKKYQNSVSLFRRTEDYSEPIYSTHA